MTGSSSNYRFGVIVSAHDQAAALPRCLESVLAQGFADYELIVVDDGSTDDTLAVVRPFADEYPHVRYVYQGKQGSGAARNLGVSLSQAKYVTFIECHDEVLPEWLESLDATLTQHNAHIVCCGRTLIDESGEVTKIRVPRVPAADRPHEAGLFFTGTFAVRKDAFQAVGGYTTELPANQHDELRMRLLPVCERNGWKIATVAEPLVRRHSKEESESDGNVGAIYESGIYVLKRHASQLRRNPRAFAEWANAAGGCAAQLGRYREARKWFFQAMRAYPRDVRNIARFLAASIPWLRSFVWRPANEPTSTTGLATRA
jgi:glycosyltransferase involved in cell wall biosynthesis